jgi:hypothetical protein
MDKTAFRGNTNPKFLGKNGMREVIFDIPEKLVFNFTVVSVTDEAP